MILDIAPFGVVFERLVAQATGAAIEDDGHQLADMRIHLESFGHHSDHAQLARDRGDLYNAMLEVTDAAINILFAWVVASRISDPALRAQAFAEINQAISNP